MSNLSLNKVYFSIAFPDIPEPIVDVWIALEEFLKSRQALPKFFEITRPNSEVYLKIPPEEIANFIIEHKLKSFWVTKHTSTTTYGFSLLHAKELGRQTELHSHIDNVKAPNDWTELIQGLAVLVPTIGAWQWQMPYQSWQWNCRVDPGWYANYGPIPPGFRRWHEPSIDGLGNGRTLIDISLNPGRPKELIFMINFYPTAEMWLGPHFWPYAKCTREEALAADFFIEKRDTPHYLYLKCWPEPFTRPEGEQGRMQQRLWKLFFHEDCEWPPGSGTISDEPTYGPPELMPKTPDR